MKVLVADGSMTLRNSLIRIVQSMPALEDVREVDCYEQLIRVSKCDSPDLILLDLFLPGGDGFTMLDQTLAMNEGSEIVVLLNNYDDDLALKAKRRGAKAVLSKSDNLLSALMSLDIEAVKSFGYRSAYRLNALNGY